MPAICRDAGVHVLSVDYRLAPEHKAPAAVEDAYAAYRWALEHAAELGADPRPGRGRRRQRGRQPRRAGGHYARATTACRLPVLQLLLYPITNFARRDPVAGHCSPTGFSSPARYGRSATTNTSAGSGVDATDPRVSPLLADDLSGLPPALVLTAGFDPLRDEGSQYADALRAAGVPVDAREYGSLVHAFANFFPLGGGSATATAEMISALRAHLSRG